jgi:DNA polymerase-4
MAGIRKIIHIDMDAFFASVEQRDDPALRGKPVIVGGTPDGRGVVAAASYEARRYGIHSAMSSARAVRLCPQAIFVKPRIARYREVSREILECCYRYTDIVEPLSLDEAYLDVTSNKQGVRSATETAAALRQAIFERTNLTASAGVAPNKFLAKIASDMQKPNGLTVVSPDRVAAVLATLPVRKVPGIGKVTEEKMATLGIRTTADLQQFNEATLVQIFGKVGRWYAQLAQGIDERPVNPERIRKSVSVEDTFSEDTNDLHWMKEQLTSLSESLARRLRNAETRGRTVTLKVTFADFEKCTRSKTLAYPVDEPTSLLETAETLLHLTEAGIRPVRLLGIGVSNLDLEEEADNTSLEEEGWRQLALPFVQTELIESY